ncbi:hypothetical protein [Pseudoduganella chitinolytica]|uniref:DUF2147 domain-containing protein n=1 Tax=Pseudoduganella chitinolytica TaxID=34070 RepID=A0ABY8BDG2_9BURK|nr:hypothetical protein [Pseudoduganella chitinolytica]WEF33746.1 hypothetical protein PX653_02850 [Pseudoduganella chitinolytica]
MKASIPLLIALAASGAGAAPLPADHPIVGIWRLEVPEAACTETYRIRADGTALVTSAGEVAETTIEIAAQPDGNGFYRAVNRIVKDNGKPDCTGQVTKPGHRIDTYILFHPSGNQFLMCQAPDRRACIGPLVRVTGDWI